MIPQTSGLVISREKLIALANVRKYHARKRSLPDITRKALHLGLSHLKTQSKTASPEVFLELNCVPMQGAKTSPVRAMQKSLTNSVERVSQWEKRDLRSTSTSALPIAVLKLVPTKPSPRPIRLPKILREVKERKEMPPVPTGRLGVEETKEGPFSLVSFAERPLVFLEDRSKRFPIPSLVRGRLKRLLSFPEMELRDNSLLGVFPIRMTGANVL